MASIKIGIAGYMGSGKSTCSRFLENTGARLIVADQVAKSLMENTPQILEKLPEEFGEAVLEKGKISYSRLGSIVFSSIELLSRFNSIVHPFLLNHLRELLQEQYHKLIVLDAALIPLWNIDSWFDLRIWIDAPRKSRLDRIMKKGPTIDKGQLEQRMAAQERLFSPPSKRSWEYIYNEDGVELLGQKVFSVTKRLFNRI